MHFRRRGAIPAEVRWYTDIFMSVLKIFSGDHMDKNTLLDLAVSITRGAASLAQMVQQELVIPTHEKQDKSPVTVGDLASQAYASAMIEKFSPGIPLVAEESSETFTENPDLLPQVTHFVNRLIPQATQKDILRWVDRGNYAAESGSSYWVLDPIDGTKGFLRHEQYAVALGLISENAVTLGTLGIPGLENGKQISLGGRGTLAAAVSGNGAWHTPLFKDMNTPNIWHQMTVSSNSDPLQARVLRSVEAGHTNVGFLDSVVSLLNIAAEPVLMDSQAKYALLACGAADMLFRMISAKQPDYREKIWDQAAGSIILQEAGGRITDLDGKPLDFSQGRTLKENRGICATNGLLHEVALEALKTAGA